ncbi:phosphotransferase [Mycobacterium paraterrae]|uniref:Phosphotransferase n=1 Tax=Mycobacterium paraterrae TaxID=577492 RepID=A0ABY3VRV2_9MYCO|nr:phosphotransferase [Mycobacterium paraterrae]UMB69902.1 phosphotransferase [Mycobacterium paraterrae]
MTMEPDEAVRGWLESHIGPVQTFERQPRWRPAWFADVERDNTTVRLYVRGDREGMEFALSTFREADVLEALEKQGIPVPHIYGRIDAPPAIVMDRLPGATNLSNSKSATERSSVLDEYMEILARIHQLDPNEFLAVGLKRPKDPQQHALSSFEESVSRYRSAKSRPEPFLEFGIGWVRRHVPAHRFDPRFLLGDPGQFMFADGRVTGLLDVELAYLGDISHDLAGLRLRNISEPFGDLERAFRRYEEVCGVPLDLPVVEFHTAQFSLTTPLSLVMILHNPFPMSDLLQYFEWFQQCSLNAVEAMAAVEGVTLDDYRLPPTADVRQGGLLDALAPVIEELAAETDIDRFRRRQTAQTARYVAEVCRHGPAIEAEDLDDLERLLGCRCADWRTGDEALEAFVLGAPEDMDADLIRLFHRRIMRQMRLLEPVLNRSGGVQPLIPLAQLLGR